MTTPDDEAAFHLAAIVESSDDAIVSKDLDGTIRSWNPGAERLFGYTAKEVIGRSIRLIIPLEQQSEEDDVLREVRSGRSVSHFETVRRRKDGRLVPISLTVSPVRNAAGQVIGASKIARDISDQRRAEEALRESMAVKDQFLGLVSHELRTPISTIVGNGQLLLRRGGSLSKEEREQALTDMVSESERLQRIVENLLVLTRLEADVVRQAASVDLGALAERVVSLLRRRSQRVIELDVRDGSAAVRGDETLVTLVLQNLISNAEKYSSAPEPIKVIVGPLGDRLTEVRVLDRGVGIKGEGDQLFEPFFRGEQASALANGMGLGLTVCRKAVEAQGGSITAQPRPGGGSVFSFSLPVLTGNAS